MQANCEKHPTIKGAWIAYGANGFAFRIHRANPGYAAAPSHAGKANDNRRFRADRLKDCADLIGASSRDPEKAATSQRVTVADIFSNPKGWMK